MAIKRQVQTLDSTNQVEWLYRDQIFQTDEEASVWVSFVVGALHGRSESEACRMADRLLDQFRIRRYEDTDVGRIP